MSYADRLKIPYCVLIGEDEMAAGVVAVKDMASGEQKLMSPAEAAAYIKEDMDRRANTAVIREVR